jgi:hypothetical protein
MSSRTASCCCGQLRIEVQGEPLGTGICHCLVCQKRTGSVFATLACFAAPYRVTGTASEYARSVEGGRVVFHFCPTCGSTVFHTEDRSAAERVDVAVGAFADPSFPPPLDSVYDSRRHAWVQLPAGVIRYEKDPT